MNRTWKVYGILVVLGGLLFGSITGYPNAGSSSEPTVLSASAPSIQSAGPALHDDTPPLDRKLHRVAKDPLQKAKDLLEAIQQHEGKALSGYIGGRAFQNRERRLPPGRYREYDVNPKHAAARGMRNGSSSSKTLAGPTIPVTITERSCH